MKISIILDDAQKIFYSTRESIRGSVKLECKEDIVIHDLSITLEGKAAVRVEKHVLLSNNAGYLFGDQTFLQMTQPAPSLPEDRKTRRHESCHVPFNFTVPAFLPEHPCDHEEPTRRVGERHLLLPPSLGNFKANGTRFDDHGPKRARVDYGIRVRFTTSVGSADPVLFRRLHRIRIMPERAQRTLITITTTGDYYRLGQDKDISRGLHPMRKVIGRMSIQTSEQTAIHALDSYVAVESHLFLTLPIALRFDPATEKEHPPQLDLVSSKLHCFTFFGASPFNQTPEPGNHHKVGAEPCQYTNTVRLESCSVQGVQWAKYRLNPGIAPGADCETARTSKDSESRLLPTLVPFYTTVLQIPIRLLPGPFNRA